MPMVPEISVIVPARDQARRLPTFFAALAAQTLARESFEVIVVDDRSTDDTVAVAEAGGMARVVPLPRHGGPYVARNAGAAVARGRLLAFTDADCTPATDWLEAGLRTFAAGDIDVAAGHIEIRLGERPTTPELIDFGRYLDQRRNVETRRFGGTGNLWVRRATFERVGRFNDKLLSGGDREFGDRAVAAGANLVYAPDVVTEHPPCGRHRVALKRAFRIGYGLGQYRYYAVGPLRDYPRLYANPASYLPTGRIFGRERLEENDYRLSLWQRVWIPAVDYFTFRLPFVTGNLVASTREGWRARRVAAGPPAS